MGAAQIVFDGFGRLKAIHHRHHNVHQYQIRLRDFEKLQCFLPVDGLYHLVAIILQHPGEKFAVGFCVIHHQNFHTVTSSLVSLFDIEFFIESRDGQYFFDLGAAVDDGNLCVVAQTFTHIK